MMTRHCAKSELGIPLFISSLDLSKSEFFPFKNSNFSKIFDSKNFNFRWSPRTT